MILANDNPGQGNRDGQESGDDSLHKSQRNQDSQKHETTSEEEALKQEDGGIAEKDKKDDKFSPGEPENYDPDEFAVD